jgi:hypothetical protein
MGETNKKKIGINFGASILQQAISKLNVITNSPINKAAQQQHPGRSTDARKTDRAVMHRLPVASVGTRTYTRSAACTIARKEK